MRRPWNAPAMRPTLARTSSAASGLRFCGMIDEPVVNRSDSRTKPNCGVIQITISSAKRDRCMAVMADAARISSAKSRSATPSSEFAIGRSKPSISAVLARSIGNDVPASAAEPSGHSLSRFLASMNRPRSRAEHLHVSQQMMTERDRLRRLQVREARHHRRGVSLGLLRQNELQLRQGLDDPIRRIADEQAKIRRHLVVARPRRMQPARRRTDDLLEPALDVHVHVFECPRELERPRLDLGEHLIEPANDLSRVGLGDDTALGEHGRMRLGAANILRRQRLVEGDGGVYLLHDLGGRGDEAATPHFIGGFIGHERALRMALGERKITMKDDSTAAAGRKSYAAIVAVAVLSAMVGFAAVYGTLGPRDNNGPASVEGAAQPAATAKPAGAGKLAGFVVKAAPEAMPDVSFQDGQGQQKSLNDFKGKTILLNLWATWCAPCREEMPSLDRLQKELGSDKFEVVALALDRGGVDAARKFLAGIKVENLKLYVDPSARSGSALRIVGMPTTILIDPEGREIGRLPGPAEWDLADAKRLIEAHLR